MPASPPVPAVDADADRRRLAVATALLDRAADHLERLDGERTLGHEHRALVDAALELVLIAREELDPTLPAV